MNVTSPSETKHMPAKKMTNRRPRKARDGKILGLTKGITLFPDRFVGTMSYSTVFTFPSIAATSMQATVLRFNSVYDPDYTGTGTAVAGYNAITALYGRYRVLKTRAELCYLPISQTVTAFAVVSCDSTLGTDFGRLVAQRHVWTRGILPSGVPAYRVIGGPVHKFAGVRDTTVRNEDSWAAIIGTNPSNQVYLHIGAYNPNSSVATIQVTVRMVFTVEWSLPIEMSQP